MVIKLNGDVVVAMLGVSSRFYTIIRQPNECHQCKSIFNIYFELQVSNTYQYTACHITLCFMLMQSSNDCIGVKLSVA